MPEKRTMERARKARRPAKAAAVLSGALMPEEMSRLRRGAQGTRSTDPIVFVGSTKARRTAAAMPAGKRSKPKARPRRTTAPTAAAAPARRTTARRRPRPARAASRTPTREATRTARRAPSRHATRTPPQRTARQRSEAALKAARTKGFAGRSAAARKAARTRARNRKARGG